MEVEPCPGLTVEVKDDCPPGLTVEVKDDCPRPRNASGIWDPPLMVQETKSSRICGENCKVQKLCRFEGHRSDSNIIYYIFINSNVNRSKSIVLTDIFANLALNRPKWAKLVVSAEIPS